MTSASTTRHPMRALRALALLGILAAGSVALGRAAVDSTAQAAPPAAAREQVLDAYAKLPLTFVENHGQTDPRVVYHAQGPRHAFFLTRGEIVFAFAKTPDGSTDTRNPTTGARGPGVHSMATAATPDAATHRGSLALRFVGSDPRVTVAGQDRAPGEVNHFRGNDPAHWHARLPGYAQVIYRELWPGVDLVLRGHPGELKYEFRVRSGARPADIRLAYAGADGLVLDRAGGLLIKTPLGVLRDSPPVAWQTIAGARVPVESRYALKEGDNAEGEYGFALGADYRADHELIIDPGLAYSSFLGGAGGDAGNGIAVDAAGNAYVVGTTQSLDFPTTAGAFDRTAGDTINGPDVFVAKLNPSGTALVYSTYLGGGGFDFGRAIAIDAAGNAYVTGKTQSANFPTTAGAFDRTANIPATPRPQVIDDGFVTKLNATGSALVYSTYLGGTDNDEPRAIAIDAAGNAHVTGETVSADFPTAAGAFDTVRSGDYDVFVTKLNAGGTALVYSTFLGGVVSEIANGIKVDPAGNTFVLGSTASADFPTTPGAFDTTHNGAFDAFVTKLNATGSALVYSTFLGGADFDDGAALAIDAGGNAFVAGSTGSADFPTTPGAYDVARDSNSGDAFVAKLNAAGSALVYSTFLGGTQGEGVFAIAVDAAGAVWATGVTSSEDFPITLDGFDISFNGVSDVFVSKLDPAGSTLVYSTLLGGASSEIGRGIGLDAAGNVYVAGETRSAEFPTTAGAFDVVWNGDPLVLWGDGFVAKFNPAIVTPSFPGPTLAALSISPASVVGGNAATGTVTLNSAALVGGAVVTLTDDSSVSTVPASVTVPAGSTSATFAVTTNTASEFGTAVAIVATLGTSRSAALTVLPPAALLSGLSVNPGSVVGGNPSTATVTLSAAQSTPTVISIDPLPAGSPVSVPASVTVPAGATSASFTIATTPVTLTTNITIGVRVQGASSPGPTALLLVAPATSGNATLTSLSLSASSVAGGSFLTGTVTLSAAAPSGGAVVTLFDNSTAATTQSSVTVPAGATSTTFILTSTIVQVDTSVLLTATFNGTSRSLTLTVTAPPPPAAAALSAISVNPASVVGGTSSAGTVTLSAAAPSGGAAVSLSDDSGAASVPASVTVPAGATSATFTVTTSAVTATTTATVSAVYAGVTRSAALSVTPPAPPPAPAAPTLVSPANDATPAQPVTLDWSDVAGAASYEVQVDTSSTIAAPFTANPSVSVSQVTLSGLPAQRLWWRVRARNAAGVAGPFSSTRRFTPQGAPAAASLSAVAVNPTSVVGPASSTGTVTLTAAAPSGGAVVSLTSSNTAVAGVPASVTVAAGATSANFSVTTTAVAASTSVTLTGTYSGVSRTTTLTVTPVPPPASLNTLALSPASVTGGSTSTGTVTLTSAAPTGGAAVALSSNAAAAAVPASVTVAAGATSATFNTTTTAVTATTTATISAVLAGVTRTAALTVNPPSSSVTLTVSATGRSGERVTSSPTGINVAVGSTQAAGFAANTSITLSVSNGRDAVWSGACSSGGNKTRNCTFTITGNASVTGNVQ